MHLLIIEQYLSGVCLAFTHEDFHKRRLPGTIFTNERVYFSGIQFKINRVENLNARI